MKSEYETQPSYKLVLMLKQCKVLLTQYNQDLVSMGKAEQVRNTVKHIKTILISRQVVN